MGGSVRAKNKVRGLMTLRIYGLIIGVFMLGGCATLKGRLAAPEMNVVYKSVDGVDLTMDVYSPRDAENSPAIMVVHGGGWRSRSGDMSQLCAELARQGYVAFNVTYRLSPKNTYPKAVDDLRDAAKWIQAQSSKYKTDPAKLYAWGYSAGSHLILRAAVDGGLGVKAIVAGGTPADLTVWPNSSLVNNFVGFTRDQRPDLWQEASPVFHVTDKTPPVFLYHGAWDMIVEPAQMDKMAEALRAKGVEVETLTIPWQGHLAVYLFSNAAIRGGLDFLKRHL